MLTLLKISLLMFLLVLYVFIGGVVVGVTEHCSDVEMRWGTRLLVIAFWPGFLLLLAFLAVSGFVFYFFKSAFKSIRFEDRIQTLGLRGY